MNVIDQARRVVQDAITDRVFPGAVVNVGSSSGVLWQEAFGTLTFAPEALATAESTPFDLASLTKVVATTTVVMDQVDAGTLRLDEPLEQSVPRRAAKTADPQEIQPKPLTSSRGLCQPPDWVETLPKR